MGVRDASRSRPVMCWKRYCGSSTQVRNGTCCRKAIRTTKLCIDAFKLGSAIVWFWRTLPTSFVKTGACG